ncbi:MAG TPA: hypothetical protein DDX98_08190 [Bacteroidales bacterium]|jgi:hypothetical protein|nr:hypothetical protein [Bacteroidales bacterium]
METLVKTSGNKINKGACLSRDELSMHGITPTNLQCFSYYNYVLYEKGDKRIILKPLPHNLFRIIREYTFIPA